MRLQSSVAEPVTSAPGRSLGLVLRSPALTWCGALGLLVVYACSMARDLSLFDSPELSLVAAGLGLGHPPGQPLHTLLGFVCSSIPGLPPLLGLNLLSAAAGALSVIPAASLADRLAPGVLSSSSRSVWPGLLVIVWIALGCHHALWEPATRVEVYSLASFCALWAMAKVGAPGHGTATGTTTRDFAWAGFILGLGACANPVISAIAALSLGPGIATGLASRRLAWRVIPAAFLGGILGLLPYVYIPLVAARKGVMVWGAPSNPHALRHFLLGLDFARSGGIGPSAWLSHVGEWLGWSAQRGVLPLLIVGLVGYAIASHARSLLVVAALSLALSVFGIALNRNWRPDLPDYLGYLLPALWLMCAGVVAAVNRASQHARPALSIALAMVVTCFCLGSAPAVWIRTRHLDRVARTMAQGALHEAPSHAIIIVQVDHWAAPLLYLQQIEHMRPDVVIIAYGLTSSSWFWQQTFEQHPQLHRSGLEGPGGRAGRVQRLLAANPQRRVLIEDAPLAREMKLRVCVAGWLRATGADCDEVAPRVEVDAAIHTATAMLGDGAPSAQGALCDVALSRAIDLWDQGLPGAAEAAALAAVPGERVPALSRRPARHAQHPGPPFQTDWRRQTPLGEPARNLFVASLLRASDGDAEGATALLLAASDFGLPEAAALIARSRRGETSAGPANTSRAFPGPQSE